jgi:two-component system cell cycle sensor histidine kinase/response regulator CckA
VTLTLPDPFAWFGQHRLIAALLSDPAACVLLIDSAGRIRRRGGQWQPLPDAEPDAFAHLPAIDAAALRAAVAERRGLTLRTKAHNHPVFLSLTPVPGARPGGRNIAAILRLTDTARLCDLEEALAQAQRLQEVGELAGGIAHDFNNLLTAILGAADDLAARAVPADQPDLAQITASAKRGAELVRQLLAFSQRQTLQPRVLVLDEAVQSAASLLARLLGARTKLKLELKAPGRLVHMDATQLDQVLMNLAINARNAMPDGGTITIATDWRLVLRAEDPLHEGIPPGRYATIEVTDTGSGIPPEILPRIFDPFFTTRRGEGGTGLGLSMVQGIVRQSGGYLSVRSTPGEGTCFRITLPRHEPAPSDPAPAQPAAPEAAATVPRHVLLVDDDDAIRRLAKRALIRAGWQVTDADGAEAALQGDCSGIDCVISDVSMPGMDGPALVRALRAQRPKLPAVLISGYADASQRQELAREDIAFLPKPFAMAALTEAVRAAFASVQQDVPSPVDP